MPERRRERSIHEGRFGAPFAVRASGRSRAGVTGQAWRGVCKGLSEGASGELLVPINKIERIEIVLYGSEGASGELLVPIELPAPLRAVLVGTSVRRAMAVAMIYPEPARGKRKAAYEASDVSRGNISKARTALKVLPETARAAF